MMERAGKNKNVILLIRDIININPLGACFTSHGIARESNVLGYPEGNMAQNRLTNMVVMSPCKAKKLLKNILTRS